MKNAPDRYRTCDIQINSLTLYHLSYRSSSDLCDSNTRPAGNSRGEQVLTSTARSATTAPKSEWSLLGTMLRSKECLHRINLASSASLATPRTRRLVACVYPTVLTNHVTTRINK